MINNWKVDESDSFSDHKMITYQFLTGIGGPTKMVQLTKKTNWGKYRSILNKKLSLKEAKEFSSVREIEEEVDYVSKSIRDAIEQSTPKIKIKIGSKLPNGWNEELTRLKQETRRRYNLKSKTGSTDADIEAYKEIRREYHSKLKKTKDDAWKEFCQSCENQSTIARLNKIMTKSNITCNRMMKRPDGEYTTKPEDSRDMAK